MGRWLILIGAVAAACGGDATSSGTPTGDPTGAGGFRDMGGSAPESGGTDPGSDGGASVGGSGELGGAAGSSASGGKFSWGLGGVPSGGAPAIDCGECPSDHQYCDFTTGECEKCTKDYHCPTELRPVCNEDVHQCVECRTNQDCPADKPTCNTDVIEPVCE